MTDFKWAVNKTKLAASVLEVQTQHKINPSKTTVDEATIKAEYEKRGGLVREDADIIEDVVEEAPSHPRRARRTQE